MYITTIIKNWWMLTTFFQSFALKQQLGKLLLIPNRLVFLFGFSKGSQKTKYHLTQTHTHTKKDLTSVSRCGIMSLKSIIT